MILLIYGINSKIIDKEKIIKIVSDYENLFHRFNGVFGAIKKEVAGVEAVIISTCLRYEILITACSVEMNKETEAEKFIIKRLKEFFNGILNEAGIKINEDKYFRAASLDAFGHLYSVMSGFESEDIGEIQVLGQIKDGYSRCHDAGMCGKIIEKIYEAGLKCVIKVRNQVPAFTDRNIIKKNILKKIHERFCDKQLCRIKAMVGGSGGCARSIASALKILGIKTDLIKKSEDVKYEQLINYDVVIFDFADVGFSVKTDFICGQDKNILVMDVSISRNVPPEAASIENIELVGIEALIPPNWKEGEIVKKRGLNRDFFKKASRIVASAAKTAFEEVIFYFENEGGLALIKEIAAIIEAEFVKSSKNMNAANYIEKNDKLRRTLIKKIPALIKRKSLKIIV